jgi:hypothetical protein
MTADSVDIASRPHARAAPPTPSAARAAPMWRSNLYRTRACARSSEVGPPTPGPPRTVLAALARRSDRGQSALVAASSAHAAKAAAKLSRTPRRAAGSHALLQEGTRKFTITHFDCHVAQAREYASRPRCCTGCCTSGTKKTDLNSKSSWVQKVCGRGESVTEPARHRHSVPAELARPRAQPQSVPRSASAAAGLLQELLQKTS